MCYTIFIQIINNKNKYMFNKFFKNSFFKISFLIFVFSFFINTNITKVNAVVETDTIITDSLGEDAILTINNSDNECELPSINISKSSVSRNSAENDNREYFTA